MATVLARLTKEIVLFRRRSLGERCARSILIGGVVVMVVLLRVSGAGTAGGEQDVAC